MKVHVTAEDIAVGKPYGANCCPVALAIARAANFSGTVSVIVNAASWNGKIVDLPAAVADFIVSFDHGESVEPLEFDLPIAEGEGVQ